jgi:hypothetical protein
VERGKIMELWEIEFGGIELPREAVERRDRARGDVASLKARVEELRAKRDEIQREIASGRADGVKVIAAGGDPAKVQAQLDGRQREVEGLNSWLAEVEPLVERVEGGLKRAEEALLEECSKLLVKQREEMIRELERVRAERAPQFNTTRDGKLHSTPPARQSRSRIAVCEGCGQPAAIFDPETLRQPVMGHMFKPLPRFDTAFIPQAELMWFKHLGCGKRPFWEEDKILTSDGFYMIPGPESTAEPGAEA